MSRPVSLARPAERSLTVTGWLLDLYADPEGELALWLLEDPTTAPAAASSTARRLRLRQAFPISFYAAGPNPRLRLLWQHLARLNPRLIAEGILTLSRQERGDLFEPEPVTVLAVEVRKPGLLPGLFQRAAAAFPDLTYYDADLPLSARHAAVYGTFPLAKLRLGVTVSDDGASTIQSLQTLDSPWDLDAPPPLLRVMHLSPDCDPRRGAPAWLEVQVETLPCAPTGLVIEDPDALRLPTETCALSAIEGRKRWTCRLSLQPERALLVGLGALLRCYDPDLLLTGWGDTWLLPHLLALSEKLGIPLPLNRGAENSIPPTVPGGLSAIEARRVGTKRSLPQVRNLREANREANQDLGLPLPCDDRQPVLRRRERSYQAYGQVIYRGQQVLLAGRWHIDRFNAMMYHDYALEGILESARVSALPVQQAARLSPGTGISTMQIVTALRLGVMTPWRKQQAEIPKSALDLLHADQGGLVYQPIIGLHRDVAEIDFVSMYPSIMARFNISPERCSLLPPAGVVATSVAPSGTAEAVTTPAAGVVAAEATPGRTTEVVTTTDTDVVAALATPGRTTEVVTTTDTDVVAALAAPGRTTEVVTTTDTGAVADSGAPGLIPQTLQPLLDKRVALKQRIAGLPGWDPRKKLYKARAAAHKWLLVTCFGYLGYKNARFGRIEAHQAVTAYSRECLLRAKEAAEDLGYTVLHMYVDGLWVQQPGASHFQKCDAPTVQAVQPLLDEIVRRTGLPIALEGIYRWVAFLPSRADGRVPVANRYFGVFQDGSLKIRGLEARRGDTPPFIAAVQLGLLERLAAGSGSGCSSAKTDVRLGPASAQDWLCANRAGRMPPAWTEILAFLRRELRRLRARRVPLEQLLVSQKLSRPLEHYRSPSPAARAAAQLAAAGISTRPGQTVRFLYLRGEHSKGEDVHAWDCPPAPPPERLDIERYTTLFMRACAAVLQPFGLDEEELRLLLMQ